MGNRTIHVSREYVETTILPVRPAAKRGKISPDWSHRQSRQRKGLSDENDASESTIGIEANGASGFCLCRRWNRFPENGPRG